MIKKILILIVITLESCVIQLVNGNEYESLPSETKEMVVDMQDFSNLDKNKIFEITGIQLKEELKRHPKSLVYIFANSCSSESCLPLSVVENYAFENGYSLFLIMNSYYKIGETLSQTFQSQLYAINSDYYQEPKSRAYIKAFRNDIGYTEFVKKEYLGSYIFYEYDSISEIKMNLNSQ